MLDGEEYLWELHKIVCVETVRQWTVLSQRAHWGLCLTPRQSFNNLSKPGSHVNPQTLHAVSAWLTYAGRSIMSVINLWIFPQVKPLLQLLQQLLLSTFETWMSVCKYQCVKHSSWSPNIKTTKSWRVWGIICLNDACQGVETSAASELFEFMCDSWF